MKDLIFRVLRSRYFQIPAAALLLYVVLGFLIAPMVVRWYVPGWCGDRLKLSAEIGNVRINPFLMTFEVRDFSIKSPDGEPIADFERLFLDFKPFGLFSSTARFGEFLLDKPKVNLVIEKDGSVNFPGLVPQTPEAPAPENPVSSPSDPPQLLFDTFSLTGGEFTVTDRRWSSPATLAIQDLRLTFNSLSTIRNRNGISSLSATTSGGETLEWQGEISLVPFASSGKIAVSGLLAQTPWAFLQDKLNLEPPLGKMNFSTDYRIDLSGPNPQVVVENFLVNLSEVSLKLRGEEREFFELGRLDLESTRFDLASNSIHVGKLRVEGPKLHLHIDNTARMNVERIVRSSEEDANKPSPDPSETAGQISGSEGLPMKLTIDSIEIKDITSEVRRGQKGNPEPLFAAKLLAVDAAELDLLKQAATVSRIGLDSIEIKDKASEVRPGRKGNPEPLFAAKLLAVEGTEIDLAKQAVTVSRIGLDSGQLNPSLDKEGKINFERILAGGSETPEKRAPGPKPGPGQTWKFLLKTFELTKFKSALSDYAIAEQPLYNIKDIDVRLTEIDGKSPMGVQVNFGVEQGGKVGLQGKLDPSAQSVEARANVDGLVLTPLGPYLTPFITIALGSATVSAEGVFRYGVPEKGPKLSYEGSFSLGDLKFTRPPSKEAYLGWGAMQVPKLKLSLDPDNLVIEQVKLSKPVGEVIIEQDKTINLSRIVKEQPAQKPPPPASGGIHKKPGKGPASPEGHRPEEGKQFPFNIGTILIDNGNVLFADLSLQPKFMARIHDLKGTITRLSSERGAISKIQLNGGVDRYGLAKIDGALDLSDYKRSTDMTIVFRNVEMSSITPYSGKFAGRTIKSGKLSTDLKYRIKENKIEGDNKIIVENLVLGEHVNSPDAVNLPLDLAVALLTDSNGRIDLGLPVSGDLADPQFSLAPLIGKAISTLITKAVTAPFRALGGLFGGHAQEKMDSVLFEPGKTELQPPEKEKLKKISEALGKKPLLRLKVLGRYSPEEDAVALKERGLRREVAKRLGIKFVPGEDPAMDFRDSKVRGTLEKMFSERFGGKELDEIDQAVKKGEIKPRDGAAEKAERKKSKKTGIVSRTLSAVKVYKIVPGMKSPEQSEVLAGELFARLVESEPVPEEELLELAAGRESAVKAEIMKIGIIGADRYQTQNPEPAPEDEGLSAKLLLDSIQ